MRKCLFSVNYSTQRFQLVFMIINITQYTFLNIQIMDCSVIDKERLLNAMEAENQATLAMVEMKGRHMH